jgi:hypothetical protein
LNQVQKLKKEEGGGKEALNKKARMHKARISSLKRDSKETSKAAASKDTGQLIVGPKRARSKVERNPVFLTTNNASVLDATKWVALQPTVLTRTKKLD